MEPLLVHPDPPPPGLAMALDRAGYPFKAAADARSGLAFAPDDGWAGAVVSTEAGAEEALALCRALRNGESPISPLLLIVGAHQLDTLVLTDDLFDDFCLSSAGADELEIRLKHLFFRTGRGTRPELVEYGPLALNLETYQARMENRPLDLTYMEYELLRFLALHPGKVFTRETLLARVWGYEYFGGARTVDVHVRRLRSKLGEEHAHLIQTVRSVGYRFGQSRWSA
ncbi:MAG: response regulator transcription factor [Acidimicrobiales bacterium]